MAWFFLSFVAIGAAGYMYLKLFMRRKFGAVVANCQTCAEIGGEILKRGGSAVDAAIATLLSEGLFLPHSMGIGGGFMATIFIKETGKVETLMARETAPLAAHENMFVDKKITGAIATAVPGEIYGYWSLHQKYGKLPWKSLFEPTIQLCVNGIRVSKYLACVLGVYERIIMAEPSMTEIFVNPATQQLYKEGEIMYRHKLAETLRIIAEEGYQAIYRGGRLGKMLVKDIQEMGGIVTEEDLQTYEPLWQEPVVGHLFDGYTLYSTPLPTSGCVLVFILNVMTGLFTDSEDLYWHRLIETFKHAYGWRTKLGDVRYEPAIQGVFDQMLSAEFADHIRGLIKDDCTYTDFGFYGASYSDAEDHGTANMAVVAPNGDGICVTSTINNHLGAKVRSRRTGIILNDQMDDFCTPGVTNAYGIPPSTANYIKPGKRPMSSICPTIIVDKDGEIRLIIGGAGGSRITTAVSQTILRYLVLNQTMFDAVNSGVFHHQLAPMVVDIEPHVPIHLSDFLMRIGHSMNYLPHTKAFTALSAIGLRTAVPSPICDSRRKGGGVVIQF